MADMLSEDFTGENQKLPSGLNVLTILTIIGSILGLAGGLWSFFTAKSSYEATKKAMESGDADKVPGWATGFMSPEMLAMQQKIMENRMPILILTIVGCTLCLYGAIEMRKRKKQGYLLWLIGEVLPVLTSFLFIGTAFFKGFGLLGAFIPILFIILYTVNRKELIY